MISWNYRFQSLLLVPIKHQQFDIRCQYDIARTSLLENDKYVPDRWKDLFSYTSWGVSFWFDFSIINIYTLLYYIVLLGIRAHQWWVPFSLILLFYKKKWCGNIHRRVKWKFLFPRWKLFAMGHWTRNKYTSKLVSRFTPR